MPKAPRKSFESRAEQEFRRQVRAVDYNRRERVALKEEMDGFKIPRSKI